MIILDLGAIGADDLKAKLVLLEPTSPCKLSLELGIYSNQTII